MATSHPDLLSLRLFVAACEQASMARAAKREAIVASAIGRRIADMEGLSRAS
jgi:DNA-binding transcriptional LysR family regulator